MRLTTFALCAAVIGCSGPAAPQARDFSPSRWRGYSLELLDEAGRVLPTFSHRGRTYVLGTLGRRYFVRVRNDTGQRVEAVVSVDGRDVVDGGPAGWAKRGYLVEPGGAVTIDGYRLSQEAVAAFRFSSVPRSYAALEGDARDVGVIGVAVFAERELPRLARPTERRLRSGETPAPVDRRGEGAQPSGAPAAGEAEASRRPGLGTEFGEEHESHVRQVPFQRASPRPEIVLAARYDDRAGLRAAGVDLDGGRPTDQELRRGADPFRRDARYASPPPGWGRAPSGS